MITCKNHLDELVTIPKEKFFFRPSAYALIRNGNDLLTVRITHTGKIWFPGGGVHQGETIKEALTRELQEEIGYKNVRIGDQKGAFENFFYYGPTDEAMHALLYFYECFTDEKHMISDDQIQDEAIKSIRWTPIDSIRKEDLGDLNDEMFAMIQSLK
jgi:8-oxo-dGTP pyrophosphatase MutT (NUDIX family)